MPKKHRKTTGLLQFGTEKIGVPKNMLFVNHKSGRKTVVPTLTKAGNLTKRMRHPSIVLNPRSINSIHYLPHHNLITSKFV